MDACGRAGIALGEERVRAPRRRARRRRSLHRSRDAAARAAAAARARRERRAEVEAGAAGDDRACAPPRRISSIASCASRWYSPTETSWSSGTTPTSRAGYVGRRGEHRDPRVERRGVGGDDSPPSRSRSARATALLPEAVGPKSATTADQTAAVLNACSISPGTRSGTISRSSSGCAARHSRNHSTARGIPASSGVSRLPVEELPRLADVGDVVGHLAAQRRLVGDLRRRRRARRRSARPPGRACCPARRRG